jgi:putative ABC transport system permease protein
MELLQEIGATVQKNKLRTALTGFSVAWGIFLLMVLLGAGQGLRNGVMSEFIDDASNAIWFSGDVTTMAYQGLNAGRQIELENADISIAEAFEGVEGVSGRMYIWGGQATYGKEGGSYPIRAVQPDYMYIERTQVQEGRFINQTDVDAYRKVALIGATVKSDLFKTEDPIGQYIKLNGIPFLVIGWFTDEGGDWEQRVINIPLTTGQRVFSGDTKLRNLIVTTETTDLKESLALGNRIRQELGAKYKVDPRDDRAINVNNMRERMDRFYKVLGGIEAFLWLVGLGTIIAGIVGVSNIMLILVKERTREIGVRKALGATPWSIIRLIVLESVIITSVSGYIGMLAGIGLLELVGPSIDSPFFKQPEVDLRIALSAMALLVIAGSLAGIIPARRAAAIQPIEALRDE